jgi:maltose alpha-D-glucosyltransferase/alpha-amylase
VESQLADPSSLLQWMRNLIALRKLFKVFGRGSMEFLLPCNRKILAYVRRDKQDVILCVANISRHPQPAELDLSEFEGYTPVEMIGYTPFPRIGKLPYFLTLGGYGFYWFELKRPAG